MKKKKILKILLIIAVIGFTAWAIIPVFLDKEVSEDLPDQATTLTNPSDAVSNTDDNGDSNDTPEKEVTVVDQERIGQFTGRNNYSAEGDVRLIEDNNGRRFVRFEDNFKASNGPDLIVYIGTENDRGVNLGALKGNIGAQNYEIPGDLDLDGVDTVRIFCRSFNVDFGIATL